MEMYLNDKQTDLKVKIADKYFKRLLGLMFKKNPPDYVLVIYPCSGIHTFFMQFNIDVLFLDRDFKVMKKIDNLGKNKMPKPVKYAKYVLESKVGSFKDIKTGDVLRISK